MPVGDRFVNLFISFDGSEWTLDLLSAIPVCKYEYNEGQSSEERTVVLPAVLHGSETQTFPLMEG
jgi:hypothetical protein